jgi:catalase
MNFNRDGAMRHTISKGKVNYWPNRYGHQPAATIQEGAYVDYQQKIAGIKQRALSKKFKDHFSQAQLFYNSLSEIEKAHVQAAFSFELDHCDEAIVYERLTERLGVVDGELANTIAEMVGGKKPIDVKPNPGKKAKNLSQLDFLPKTPTIKSRRIAIIIADGYDPIAFNAMYGAIKAQSALPFVIGPRRSAIFSANEDSSSSKGIVPDHHLEGQRSTMFDAIFVPGGQKSIQTLSKNGRALHYIREAFGHLKAIGGTGEAVDLINKAIQLPEVSLSETDGSGVVDSYGVVTLKNASPDSLKEIVTVASDAKGFLEKFVYNISQHRNWQRELDGLSTMVAY